MNISKSVSFFAAGLLSDLITGIQIVTTQFKYVENVQKVLMHKTNLQSFMQKQKSSHFCTLTEVCGCCDLHIKVVSFSIFLTHHYVSLRHMIIIIRKKIFKRRHFNE